MRRKRFNITGLCVPERHYMVDLGERLKEIRELVDDGAYFVINRARQYGKTTVLHALAKALTDDYFVVRLDFQALGSASYRDENIFSITFASCFAKASKLYDKNRAEEYPAIGRLQNIERESNSDFDLRRLFQLLQELCESVEKPIVLMIDEIDSAQNNQVFMDFLAQLRNYYLERESSGTRTFQSVILAGVYDIRNLRRKIRQDEEHKFNSPWNIAAKFKVNMSFDQKDIAGMLKEYEKVNQTGMNVEFMSGLIYDATSGYPFLVSEICKLIDEEISGNEAWTKEGFLEAERMILTEKNPLFDSMLGKLREYPELNDMLKMLLFTGADISYNVDEPAFDVAAMFGFIKNKKGQVVIANRIFETRLYNFYLSAAEMQNMDIYKALRRTDVIVDYHGEQFIIEMKVWHGDEYNKRGERQLTDYLEEYHQNKGYMLSFNFNKKKQIGVHEMVIHDKVLIEAVV